MKKLKWVLLTSAATMLAAFAMIVLATSAVIVMAGFIVTRHDTPDEAYVAFARALPVTSAVVRYSATDVAGTLVRPDWILSAAHVAETIEPGQLLRDHDGDSVEVAEVILHPGWIENGRPEDIALIRLTEPVDGARPVELYAGTDERDKKVVVLGNGDFGTGLTGPKGNDGAMRAGTNRVDDATESYLVWRFDDPREGSTRATRLEAISGPGDSAGPAFIQVGEAYHLAGISSGQSTNATGGREGRYGVTEYYARVSTYVDWIRHVLDEHADRSK